MNRISKFAKKVNNNEKVFSTLYDDKVDNNVLDNMVNIESEINKIFNSKSYIYKADVIINIDDKVLDKRIIGRNSKYLITNENELIEISKIKNIKIKTG